MDAYGECWREHAGASLAMEDSVVHPMKIGTVSQTGGSYLDPELEMRSSGGRSYRGFESEDKWFQCDPDKHRAPLEGFKETDDRVKASG